jgi:hypothetical protein
MDEGEGEEKSSFGWGKTTYKGGCQNVTVLAGTRVEGEV